MPLSISRRLKFCALKQNLYLVSPEIFFVNIPPYLPSIYSNILDTKPVNKRLCRREGSADFVYKPSVLFTLSVAKF